MLPCRLRAAACRPAGRAGRARGLPGRARGAAGQLSVGCRAAAAAAVRNRRSAGCAQRAALGPGAGCGLRARAVPAGARPQPPPRRRRRLVAACCAAGRGLVGPFAQSISCPPAVFDGPWPRGALRDGRRRAQGAAVPRAKRRASAARRAAVMRLIRLRARMRLIRMRARVRLIRLRVRRVLRALAVLNDPRPALQRGRRRIQRPAVLQGEPGSGGVRRRLLRLQRVLRLGLRHQRRAAPAMGGHVPGAGLLRCRLPGAARLMHRGAGGTAWCWSRVGRGARPGRWPRRGGLHGRRASGGSARRTSRAGHIRLRRRPGHLRQPHLLPGTCSPRAR